MNTRKFKNGEEVDVYNCNEIVDKINTNDEEKEIIRDIVNDLFELGANRFKLGESISIPYTVVIQKSILLEVTAANAAELTSLRKKLTKQEYADSFREIYNKDKGKIESARLRKKHADYIRQRNKSKYNIYFAKYGMAYAEAYMTCLSLCIIVPFDEEVEEMYQLLYNEKDRD